MQDISDKILVQAAAGDMDSFHQIYTATSGFVYNVAHRVTNNREDAEDVTQEVFLKIHRNLNNFQFRSSFKTWIYRITVNTAINATKRTSKDLNRRVDFDKTVQSLGDKPESSNIDKEANELKVKALLDKLNPDQRACIVLREIEGLSYEEIAKSLKINLNTVRSRLKRARETLLAIGQKRGDLK